jgi:hypothetical protein
MSKHSLAISGLASTAVAAAAGTAATGLVNWDILNNDQVGISMVSDGMRAVHTKYMLI